MGVTPALRTDHYELTMLSSWLDDGLAERPAVFEAFSRSLPPGRRYGVVAGIGRLVALLPEFRFGADDVAWLLDTGVVTPRCADFLAGFRFRGTVRAYAEGEVYVPYSPVVTVEGTLAECVVLETLVLSVLNHDCAIASAAARMHVAARGRPLLEMGARRTHEDAAVAAARAAYVCGFAGTSCLAAGRLHGVPTVGTASHAFTLSHPDERAAFAAQVRTHGPGTTLLVDTYDIADGIRSAVAAAGPRLDAVRIDSGNLAVEARRARQLLDALGARDTRIVVTSDLDEFVIAGLADAPVDAYGVGTRLVTGSGHPTASFVYKLVEIGDGRGGMRPVGKRASGKTDAGGRKVATRLLRDGVAVGERLVRHPGGDLDRSGPGTSGGDVSARALQRTLVHAGEPVDVASLDEARAHHRAARGELPEEALSLSDGPAVFVAVLEEEST